MQLRRRLVGPTALILGAIALIVTSSRVAESAAPQSALRSGAAPSPAATAATAAQAARVRALLAARTAAPTTIQLASVAGRVEIADAGTDAWKAGVEGAALKAEDQLRTGDDGFAMLQYADATLRVMPASLAILGHTSIRLKQGTTWMRMRKSGGTFQIETPSVAVSVCGTLVRAEAGKTGSTVQLIHGCVDVKTRTLQQARLQPQQQAVAPNAGGLTIIKMDPAAMQRLSGEYTATLKQLPPRGKGNGGAGGGSDSEGGGSEEFGGGGTEGSGGGGNQPRQRDTGGRSGSGRRSSTGVNGRSSLSNLQGMMDSRSTGLAAPAAGTAGTDGTASTTTINSSSSTRTVQTQPGGASSRANPALLTPAPVPALPPGGAGAAGAPPPR